MNDIALLRPKRYSRAIIFGWGWDRKIPLRPWPQFWRDDKTERGNLTTGVAWFGLYISIGRKP